MATLEQYRERLRKVRQQHAWEGMTNPQMGGRPAGEAYMYVLGHQSGLERAEKLVQEILDEEKKGSDAK